MRPFPSPVFDRLQYNADCKRSKTGGGNGLGKSSCPHLLLAVESTIVLLRLGICGIFPDVDSRCSKMASSREGSGGEGGGDLLVFGVEESRRGCRHKGEEGGLLTTDCKEKYTVSKNMNDY